MFVVNETEPPFTDGWMQLFCGSVFFQNRHPTRVRFETQQPIKSFEKTNSSFIKALDLHHYQITLNQFKLITPSHREGLEPFVYEAKVVPT